MDINEMMKMFDMKNVAQWWNVENMKQMSEENLEKAKKANEVLVEGMNTFATRQAELTKECVESNISAVKEVTSAKTPEEFASKQQAVIKTWMEKNTEVAKELSEIAKTSNDKAAEIVKDMMSKS